MWNAECGMDPRASIPWFDLTLQFRVPHSDFRILIQRRRPRDEDLRSLPAPQRALLLLALLPAVRGEVHQAQGRTWGERAVHHDLEPHGHRPRRAAPVGHS